MLDIHSLDWLVQRGIITPDEIIRSLKEIYCGKEVTIADYRKNDYKTDPGHRRPVIIKDVVDRIYPYIITFESGLSCSMAEWAIYCRNTAIPIGLGFRSYDPEPIVKMPGRKRRKNERV